MLASREQRTHASAAAVCDHWAVVEGTLREGCRAHMNPASRVRAPAKVGSALGSRPPIALRREEAGLVASVTPCARSPYHGLCPASAVVDEGRRPAPGRSSSIAETPRCRST